ncbi:MAG: hypothetical protein F4234_12220, partial [Gammaproteobacteria bacterium]|nr:hypothetical protein [Gammaproteobacteria bacterium]
MRDHQEWLGWNHVDVVKRWRLRDFLRWRTIAQFTVCAHERNPLPYERQPRQHFRFRVVQRQYPPLTALQELFRPDERPQIRRGVRLPVQKLGAFRLFKYEVAAVDGLGAGYQFPCPVDWLTFSPHRQMRVRQPAGIEQIRRKRGVSAFLRISFDVGIAEQPFLRPHGFSLV